MSPTSEEETRDELALIRKRDHSWTADADQVDKEFLELALDEPEYQLDEDEAAEFILRYSIDPHVSIYLFDTSSSD